MKLKNGHILAFILIVATILRTYDLFNIPFTHDEFSALFRLQFDNFSELIANGVRIDGHPAGIHVFLYYWTALFGQAEWAVKLPFILFGIVSIWFVFKIGKLWKNETVGLIAGSFMAVSQFTVMYSLIARPYISGLFFSLLMVFFWSKLVLHPTKRFYRNLAGFVLGASLCTYNHHFSMLFAVIVGLSGLFLIERKFLLRYILAGLAVFILYLPHLEILLYQMKMGGVEGWLAKPSNDFLWRFIQFMFNYSWWFLSLTLVLIVYGFWKGKRKVEVKTYLIFGAFFLIPFFVGFFYSKYVNAVLQFSVLIFSAPYLYFLIFGHLKTQKFQKNVVIVLSVLTFGIVSLVFERQHYKLFYENYYRYSLLDYEKFLPEEEQVPMVIDARQDIVEYYAKEQEFTKEFIWYSDFQSKNEFVKFLEDNTKEKNFFYLSLDVASDPSIIPLVQNYYPNIVKLENYFNGTNYLFSAKEVASPIENRELISEIDFSGEINIGWSGFTNDFIKNQTLIFDKSVEWGPVFERDIKLIVKSKNDFVDVVVSFGNNDDIEDVMLVMEITNDNEENHWTGVPLTKLEGISNIFGSLKLADIKTPLNGKLKVYVWNKSKESFSIESIKIFWRKGNPFIYGLFYPIH
ncbi:MAG: hypothetical protein COA32_08845 [Fluviicola sp.]|nr:MAG: hypothetical protein COA32_08845 [Fluviicola sp.]